MFQWDVFLNKHRSEIIKQWQTRLHRDISERYGQRPPKELEMTTANACDAFCDVLSKNNYNAINKFINDITRIRLNADFPLADVQKAFELYREILLPLLLESCPSAQMYDCLQAVNRCLAFTIHEFSSHFQKMHESYLKNYAQRLEADVAERTIALKDSKEQYQRLVEEISDGYLALHKENIAFVNQAFCRMHKADADHVMHRSFLEFVAPEDRKKVQRLFIRPAEHKYDFEAFEYLRLLSDGTCLPTEINFRPSWFKGHEYHLGIVRDITKRVEMEKKSRKLERMAYIGKLTASLSHEIRNPLSSVKMNLQIISKNHTFRGNDKKRLDISAKEIQRLEDILKELLDFAKPFALQRVKTDINRIVSSCVALLEVKFNKQKINCTVIQDKKLPKIPVDPKKIEQVVINLLINALESLETTGNIQIETQPGRLAHKEAVIIRVSDDGKGIQGEKQNQVFKPFYTTKTNGAGLGLANVQRIVTAHKGRIRIVKTKDDTTAFEVLLPGEENDG